MSGRMSANDPGRVKTPTLAARVETFWRNSASCELIMLRTPQALLARADEVIE